MQGLSVSGESREFFARGRIAELRRWWSRTGRPEPRRIVDYGCGVGDAVPLLAEAFPEAEVTGLDPSGDSIARARASHGGNRLHFAVLNGGDDTRKTLADLIHLNGVLHHVMPADRPAFFRDVAERLGPGSVVALFDNNPLNPGARLVMARIPFDQDAVPVWPVQARRGLRGAGLEPLATRYLFYFPASLASLRPLERLLVRLPLGAQYGVLAEASRPPR
jgi:SAM-dependent methyltransferase